MMRNDELAEVLKKYSGDPFFDAIVDLDINSRDFDGDSLLHRVVLKGDLQSAKILIANGASVNSVGDMGNTALHYAAQQNNYDMAFLLIASGGSTAIENEFGMDVLEWAKSNGAASIVKLIVDRTA